ncbi:hypothetical protein GW17_00011696, partial [Ensete ventricosum]
FKAHGFPTPGRLDRRRMPLLHTPRKQRSRLPALASSDDVDAFTKYSGYLFEGGASAEAEFLDAYDLPLITAIYRRKPLLVLRRFIQISATFGRWFAVRYLDSVSDRSDEMFKASSALLIRAAELRAILLELGPLNENRALLTSFKQYYLLQAFVKIAQAVSSRPVSRVGMEECGDAGEEEAWDERRWCRERERPIVRVEKRTQILVLDSRLELDTGYFWSRDVIPPAYLEELSLLQDRITPFSTETAFNMIEKELGQPIDILFSEISPEPTAAASLGQVLNA